jgi:hypothetical protein
MNCSVHAGSPCCHARHLLLPAHPASSKQSLHNNSCCGTHHLLLMSVQCQDTQHSTCMCPMQTLMQCFLCMLELIVL